MHDDDKHAMHVGKFTFTSFPTLTGCRPRANQGIRQSVNHTCKYALPDVRRAVHGDDTLLASAFQAAWANILSAYTGSQETITFLSNLPRSRDNNCQSLKLCSCRSHEYGQARDKDVRGHVLYERLEQDVLLRESQTNDLYPQEGTFLDLSDLLGPYDECDISFGTARLAAGVLVQVSSSSSGVISFSSEHLEGLLNQDAAKLMLLQLEFFLGSFLLDKETPDSYPCATSPLLSSSNQTPRKLETFSSLQSQFESTSQSEPELVALDFRVELQSPSSNLNTIFTYGELNDKADAFAAKLQDRLGSVEGQVIPICMDRYPEIYISLLGILKAGASWCPIDPAFPPRRRCDLIARAGAKGLVVNESSPQDGVPEGVVILNINDVDPNPCRHFETPSIGPDDLAYLIWTSGTTGLPKGVPITHGAAVASMRSLQACVPTDTRDGNVRCLQFSQFTFDVFVQDLFYTWGVGGTLICANRTTMLGSFSELTKATRATHAHLTPAFAASVPRKSCPTLEVVTMIGEKLAQNVADDWSEDCRLYNTYGPAETTVVSTLRQVPHGDTVQSANIGHPLPSVSTFVMHNGEPALKMGIGELALGGPQLAKGYWKDSTKTADHFMWNERLQTTLYMTGDVARQLHDGSFEFVGRTDDLVKIQGIRIELSEIAFALRSCHTKVRQVEVFHLERPDRPSKVIVAFLAAPDVGASQATVITNEESAEIARNALEVAKMELPDYMIPKIFLIVGTIPRTSSAKIDRVAIKQAYAATHLGLWENLINSNQNESTSREFNTRDHVILQCVAKLTGTSTTAMSRQSALTSIGIDSITATRLAARLHSHDVGISIASILQCQTLDDLLNDHRHGGIERKGSAFDLMAFHNEYLDSLNHGIAKNVELIMPVLPLQESLLSESLQNPSSYWSHKLFDLNQEIDISRLEQAWIHVAQNTEALRTAFYPVANLSLRGTPTDTAFVQIICKDAALDWAVVSQSGLDFETKTKNLALKIVERHQHCQFSRPPWAVSIVRHSSHDVMMFSIHHSIRDEPSVDFIMSDLVHVYLHDTDVPPHPRHQLRDAISLLHTDHEQDELFWARCLSEYADAEETKSWPELKLTNQDSDESTVAYGWQAKMSYQDLQSKAAGIGAKSVASLLRLAWGALVVKYLETDKIVFGETWSVRGEASSLTDVVGPLISVIPVPFRATGTSRYVLQSMNDFQKKSRAHIGVHPRSIRRTLGKSEQTPLYPTIFNFMTESDKQEQSSSESMWCERDDVVELSIEHAIALNASLSDHDSLEYEIIASRQAMDLAHLEILARQLDEVVDLILERPDEPLEGLSNNILASVTPTKEVAVSNNAWVQAPTEWVDHYCSRHPDWTAAEVVSSFSEHNVLSEKWTYEELHTAYRNVAALINDSACSKHMIAVCLDRRLDVYAAVLGIMSTGNTYLPIAEDLPQERKRFLLKDSDAVLLITTKSLAPAFSESNQFCRTVFVEDIDYTRPCQMTTDTTPQPSDSAYLLYTSGSTGTPKGVLVSRGNLMTFIEAISQFIGSHVDMASLQGNGKWLGMASYAFDVHLLEMFFPWRHGMSTVTAPRVMLLDTLELAMQRLKVTHASFVPSLVDSAGLDPSNLPDLRYMSVGGEKISKKVIETWSQSHVTLANAYGPTEVTIGCCFKKVEPGTNVRNIGPPLPYTVAHVLRPGTIEYALRGTSGELCLTGDLVAIGYHKRPDAKGFIEDFHGKKLYRTGDLVRLLADGSLEFLGRNDDQTKIRGQRIELGEVSETVRTAIGKVLRLARVEAASIVVQHPSLARLRLVTFVTAEDKSKSKKSSEIIDFPQVEEVRAYCSKVTPAFMVPDHVILLTSLPLVTISRKVDNKRLQALFTGMSVSTLISPKKQRSPTEHAMGKGEETVRNVVSKVLLVEREKVSADTNLFQLGLDSLNAISLIIKLQKEGVDCTVSNVLKNPTVAQIAALPRQPGYKEPKRVQQRKASLEQRFTVTSRNGYELSNIAAVMPCLPLQETLIASSLDREGEALYVNHVTLELSQEVDHGRLLQAWDEIAKDHEILRTCFYEFEKHFVQVVLKDTPLSRNVGLGISKELLQHREPAIASDIIRNIDAKPPIRLTLALSEQGSILLVSLHHALYDAESFSMILGEVYDRYQQESPSKTRTPIIALIDYIQSRNTEEAKSFWESYLGGYRSIPLPLSPAGNESTSVRKELSLPLSRIEILAASMNGTPPSLMQALFGVVLAGMLETNDIVFGTILSGRTTPVENAHTILAPCITTVPQRVRLTPHSSIRASIQAAQEGFVESIEYQHTALRDIHRWVKAKGPLFDVLFSYTRKQEGVPWSHLWHEVESSMPSEFPLAIELEAVHTANQLIARCDFTPAFGGLEKAKMLLAELEKLAHSLEQGEDIKTQQRLVPNDEVRERPRATTWTEQELIMKEVVADMLDLASEEIAKDTSFFTLGLDSIIAIQFVKRLRQHNIQCSSADVMRYSCIEDLAEHVALAKGGRLREGPPQVHGADGGASDTYPCTPLQSSMLTQTLGSDGSLYVHHHAIRLSAQVDLSTMKRSVEKLVQQADILRTSFHFLHESRSWKGLVHEELEFVWNVHNNYMAPEQEMKQIKESYLFRNESDFAKPPWGVDVIGKDLVFSFHHSLYDGESLGLLLEDLAGIYNGSNVPERPPFHDVARIISQVKFEAEDYWSGMLDSFRNSRILASGGHVREINKILQVDLHKALENCKHLGVTLQSAAILALVITLGSLSGQRDIVIGHVVRGRSLPEIEANGIIGPLFNTVPLRVSMGGASNAAAMKKIQEEAGRSQAYQHASLSRIQQAWRERIGDLDAELFDTLFVFQKRKSNGDDAPWTAVDVEDDAASTEYPTNIEIEQRESEISVNINSRCITDLSAFLQTFERNLNDIFCHLEDSATATIDSLPSAPGSSSNFTCSPEPQHHTESPVTDSSLNIFREVLADVSGIPVANIADDASIFSLGLDSLSAIQIASKGRKKGLNVTVADILQGRTVVKICERIVQKDTEIAPKASHSDRPKAEFDRKLEGSNSLELEIARIVGLRDDDIEEIVPCLPGQMYHLKSWLKSGRTMGEAMLTFASQEILDLDRLRNAWRQLRRGRPILRSIFVAKSENSAYQVILNPRTIRSDAFQCIRSSSARPDTIARIVRQETCRRFDLFSPPVELLLVQSDEKDYVVLKMHHALYDMWTIQNIIQDLAACYKSNQLGDTRPTSILLHEVLQSPGIEASQQYWRKSLQGCEPTIFSSQSQKQQSSRGFFIVDYILPNLQHLEKRCQELDTSLPTIILIAFARTLTHFSSTTSPTFGLYQTGRSSNIKGLETSCIPTLNVTPLMIHDAATREVRGLIEDVQGDLAESVPFEQSYLHEILDWIGYGQRPLFNTFVNILWGTNTTSKSDKASNDLLSPYDIGTIKDIAPRDRVLGRTAVDALDISILADGSLFLDVQRCGGEEDCVRFFVRCDEGVLAEGEAKSFMGMVGEEVGRCLGEYQS